MGEPEDVRDAEAAQAMSAAEALAQRAEELAARADELARQAESVAQSDEEIARLEKELAALEEEKRRLDREFAELGAGADEHAGPGDENRAGEGAGWGHDHGWHGHGDYAGFSGFSGFASTMASRLSALGARLGETMSDAFGSMHLRATDTVERSMAVDGPVAVRVENFSGWVAVRAGREGAVTAVAERYAPRDADLDDITLEIRADGPGRVAVRCASTGTSWFARGARLTVMVPPGSASEVSTQGGTINVDGTAAAVQARTAGGSIHVSGTAGEAHTETVGGSIHVADHDGSVHAHTLGGSIHLAGHLSGGIDAETQGGSITIQGVDGAVRAGTNGGSVNVSGRLRGECTLRTSGGSVTVAVPADNQLRVDGKGTGASSDFAEVSAHRGRLDGVIGDGSDGEVRLRTAGGSVNLRRLP